MYHSTRLERLKARRKRSAQQPTRLSLEMMEDRTVPAQALAVGTNLSLSAFGPNSGAHVGDSLYFLAHQSTDAPGVSEIWQVKGQATAQELNVPALAGMSIDEIANVNGTLYVTAAAPQSPSTPPTTAPAVNLWKIDPSASGGATELTSFTTAGAGYLQPLGNKLIFQYTPFTGLLPTPAGSSALWVSDGTVAGTAQLTTFGPGTLTNLAGAVAAGGELYFTATANLPSSPVLWATDGTTAGTQAVGGMSSAPSGFTASYDLTAAGDSVYVTVGNGTEVQLWKATAGNATLVRSFDNASGILPGPVVSGGTSGNVYFALNQASGDQVWTTDGTDGGTTLLAQLPASSPATPPTFPTTATIDDIALLNGGVYFTVVNGGGLMKADGQGGANKVPLPSSLTGVSAVSAVGGRLYFMADDGVHGTEMWTTDGTTAGTVRLTDINPGSGSSFPLGPEQAGGALYVAASDGITTGPALFAGEQLWMLPDPSAPAGAAATTTLTTSPASPTTGGPITLTATVTAADSISPAPTGEVVFRDESAIYGTAPLVNGTATLSTSITVPGSHNLQAVYTGDGAFDESISASVPVTAGPSSTTVALTTSDAIADPGETVTFTATITAAAPGAQPPGGSVSFFDGTKFLGAGFVNGNTASYQTSSLAAGQHTITAVYGGDTTYSPSTSAALTETVGAKYTLSLTTSKTGTTLGQPITLTTHVTASDGSSLAPGTAVLFRDAATPLGSGTVNASGDATLTVNNLGVGSHSISAALINGGAEFDSPAVAVNVQQAATTLALRSTAPTAPLGQAITFTVTLSLPASGLPGATGTVTFKDGQVTLGTASVANSRAVFRVPSLALGTHSITASYTGDGNYHGSSASMNQTITPSWVATTIRVAASDMSAVVGEQIALSATVTPKAGDATPVGSVLFKDGQTSLGAVKIDPSGHALLLTSSLGTGNHSITASFSGAGIFTGSTSTPINVSVRLGTTAKLTVTSKSIVAGQNVTLSATVAAAAGGAVQPAGSVTFYDGTAVIGTAAIHGGVANVTTGPMSTTGVHRITATYSGNTLFNAAGTNAIYVNVRADGTTTTLLPPAQPAAGTGVVTLIANVGVHAPGAGLPTGKVTFSDGNTTLGTATVTGGKATMQLPKLAAGTHYLRAVFNGTGIYGGSSSSIVRYTIQAKTSTTLKATAAAFGQATQLKATVAVLSPGFGKAGGDVRFLDGTTVLGTAHVHDGIASLGVKLATGAHHLTAIYVGTSDFSGSSAAALIYGVTKATPSLSLNATPTNPKAGTNVTLHLDMDPATAGAAGPTGSILLTDGTTILGTIPLGHGTVNWQTTRLAKGTHTIKATYAGDGNYVARSATATVTIA